MQPLTPPPLTPGKALRGSPVQAAQYAHPTANLTLLSSQATGQSQAHCTYCQPQQLTNGCPPAPALAGRGHHH